MKSNYISGKSIIKNEEYFDTIKELLPVFEEECLSLEDFRDIWVGICYAFPEYDVYSFLNGDTVALSKLDSPYTEEELKEEKALILDLFDSMEALREFDIFGLTDDVISYYVDNGDFTFIEGNIPDDINNWDFIFPFPSEDDDKDTLKSKRRALKPFIDWAVAL